MIRKLSLDEIKQIQVEMLVDFDAFCRKNNITYYLAYGTLLGAVRHKGYIPWDDDVDVMVPRPEVERLKKLYTSSNYKIIDTDNDPNYEFPYPRLVATKTFQKKGIIARTHGVFIDIYTIDACPVNGLALSEYRKKIEEIRKKRWMWIRLRNKLYKYIPINRFPFVKKYTLAHRNIYMSVPYDSSDVVHACYSSHIPLQKKWLSSKVEVEFENHLFYAPAQWDEVLTNFYGNYMQLPPIDHRRPYHNTDTYYIYE